MNDRPRNLQLKFAILEKYRFQADFCQVIGLSTDKLSRIINKRIAPTGEEMVRIAEMLGCTPGDLF